MAKFFKGAPGRLLLRLLLRGTNAAGQCSGPGTAGRLIRTSTRKRLR